MRIGFKVDGHNKIHAYTILHVYYIIHHYVVYTKRPVASTARYKKKIISLLLCASVREERKKKNKKKKGSVRTYDIVIRASIRNGSEIITTGTVSRCRAVETCWGEKKKSSFKTCVFQTLDTFKLFNVGHSKCFPNT